MIRGSHQQIESDYLPIKRRATAVIRRTFYTERYGRLGVVLWIDSYPSIHLVSRAEAAQLLMILRAEYADLAALNAQFEIVGSWKWVRNASEREIKRGEIVTADDLEVVEDDERSGA